MSKKLYSQMSIPELKDALEAVQAAIRDATPSLQREMQDILSRIKDKETTVGNRYVDLEPLAACIEVLKDSGRPLNPVEAHELLVAGGYARNDKAGQGVIRDTLFKNSGERSSRFIKDGRTYRLNKTYQK